MQLPKIQKPLIVIVGPTGVGKSAFSFHLAKEINGEIVSADSRLFYKGMDIGTAKPSREERQSITNHLIDIITPDQGWSVADFQREANYIISQIHGKGKIPILVGGTGQYIWGLLEGWNLPDVKPNLQIRRVLEKWGKEVGTETLHAKLALLDPLAASRIDKENLRRTVRAFEVMFSSGIRFSEQWTKKGSNYSCMILGLRLPREELYRRIDDRIGSMLKQGLVEEVENLLKKGYSSHLPAFSAIGYSQVIQYLQGRISLEEAITLIKHQSRILVRRQANWFKENDPRIHWFNADEPQLIEKIIRSIMVSSNWNCM
jgi:tRNA dimethylallyltransferase